jgi:type II secretion system protein C
MNRLADYSLYGYVALSAVFAALLVASILNYMLTVAAPVYVAQPVMTASTNPAQLATGVTERNIFAIEKGLPMTAEQGGDFAGGTSGFNGKLTGILLGQSLADSRVIIAEANGLVQIVMSKPRAGADPQASYILKDVGKDFAVVSYGGQDFSLNLQAGDMSTSSGSTNQASSRNVAANVSGLTSTSDDHFTLERGAMVDQLSDINKVISSMLVSPAYNGDEFLGYRVTRMRADAPLQALGIKRGDILNRINGEPLTNPQILFDMLGKISDINAISLDITRADEKKTIFVEIQ